MAESFAHKWGQIVGDLIELATKELLQRIASGHKLYLDCKGERKARPGRKVTWKDRYGNTHDLDYVLERGGTEDTLGLPAAFIEIAWRRYTKHSRNKAQEIEGAIVPLSQTYSHLHPFLGIILAGEFTKGSLDQLQSRGFVVLHFPYNSVIKAFEAGKIDASFGEKSSEGEFKQKISAWEKLTKEDITRIKNRLCELEKEQLSSFVHELTRSLSRHVIGVTVIVLHGEPLNVSSVKQAIEFITKYADKSSCNNPVLKYEIDVKYNNGDIIHAIFQHKPEAIRFLETFS